MKWNLPIAIPTRGGASKQKTLEKLPESIRKNVVFFSGEKIQLAHGVAEVQTPGLKIPAKRQYILDYFRKLNQDFAMVDDDVSFFGVEEGKTVKIEEAHFDKFMDVYNKERDIGLLSTTSRAFCNASTYLAYGVGKFVIHRLDLITEEFRYDRYPQFEDMDFYFQVMGKGVGTKKNNTIADTNDYDEHSDPVPLRDEILRSWKREFPHLIDLLPGESLFAGGKKVGYKVRIKWANQKLSATTILE